MSTFIVCSNRHVFEREDIAFNILYRDIEFILIFTGLLDNYFHLPQQVVCINMTRAWLCHLQQRRMVSTGTRDTTESTLSPSLSLSHAISTHLWLQVTPLSVRLLELLLPLTVPCFSFPVSTPAELSPQRWLIQLMLYASPLHSLAGWWIV